MESCRVLLKVVHPLRTAQKDPVRWNKSQFVSRRSQSSCSPMAHRRYYSTETPVEDMQKLLEEERKAFERNYGEKDEIQSAMQAVMDSDLPFLSELEKKIMRHKVTDKGKYILPDPGMVLAHTRHRKKVVIAGGNGWLAQGLRAVLIREGHVVNLISRAPTKNWPFGQNLSRQYYDISCRGGIPDCDVLVQLTGAPYLVPHQIPTAKDDLELFESRSGITKLLAYHLPRTRFKPTLFIQGSHAGIYPANGDQIYDETYNGPYSNDLVGQVSADYEASANEMSKLGIRTVQMRFGHVIGDEGYLPNVHRIDSKGRAWWSTIGNGEQWMPWIHAIDAVGMMTHVIRSDNIQGVVNAVAPQLIQQREFANVLKKGIPGEFKLKVPMTETAAHWMYPKRAQCLLEGRKVIPKVALDTRYSFLYPTIQDTIASLEERLVPVQWQNPANISYESQVAAR